MLPSDKASKLKARYTGQNLRNVDGPQAVLDVAPIRKNCQYMLKTAEALNLDFRAHVKTHKTIELTRLQVGSGMHEARIVVSTVAEAEFLSPLLLEWKNSGRSVNVIYGIPPSSTCGPRLAALREQLGPTSISFLIDHPAQLKNVEAIQIASTSIPVPIFVKVDSGYHRAGLSPNGDVLKTLLIEIGNRPGVILQGFYGHNSLSYNVNSPQEALEYLRLEIQAVAEAARKSREHSPGFLGRRFCLTVGASPSVTSAQNLLSSTEDKLAVVLRELITQTKRDDDLELHAGVYPVLDMQQLATHARPSMHVEAHVPTMSAKDIGMFVLAEILSIYPAGSRGKGHEALIGAGTLALGREPCKSYAGWGVLAPWPGEEMQVYSEVDKTGWIVSRISQEHGILTWEGGDTEVRKLNVGDRCLIYPNHACMAGACFDNYLVVDSSTESVDERCKIIDVWSRARGW